MSPRRPRELFPSSRPLQRHGQDELAGVEDERVYLVDLLEVGEMRHLLLDVDVGQAVVAEDAELAAQAQVDAGRLEVALLPGVDDEPARFDLGADVTVAEDGRCLLSRTSLPRGRD